MIRISNYFQGLEVYEGQKDPFQEVTAIVDGVNPQELRVDHRTVGLVSELNVFNCAVYQKLIRLLINIDEQYIEALIDSGASHNFVSKTLVNRLQLKTQTTNRLEVQIANKYQVYSAATYTTCIQIGTLIQVENFYVLDTSLDMVLGMPLLNKVNPYINWEDNSVRVYRKCRWVYLPVCTTKEIV